MMQLVTMWATWFHPAPIPRSPWSQPRLQVAQFAQALGNEPREFVVTQAEMASAGAALWMPWLPRRWESMV